MRYWMFLLFLIPLLTRAQDPVPVANNTGQINWTANQLKSIFIGERSFWPNRQPVVIVLPSSDSDSFERIAQWSLETDGFDYQKHWLSLVFQGRANAPVFVKDEEEVMEYVADHDGAIGLIFLEDAPSALQLRIQ